MPNEKNSLLICFHAFLLVPLNQERKLVPTAILINNRHYLLMVENRKYSEKSAGGD